MLRRRAEPTAGMKALTKTSDAEPNGFFSSGGGKRGAMIPAAEAMAQAHATMRRASPVKTARARIELAPTKKRAAPKPLGPTPERLAKGDIPHTATAGGFHRSVPPVERLYKTKKLSETCVRENLALFEAAERLKAHFDRKSAFGVQAQDLTRVRGSSGESLYAEESWVSHKKNYDEAMVLMGYWPNSPTRGSAKIVEAVVCLEMGVGDAGSAILPAGRTERVDAIAMEKLRQGLFNLAVFWGMLRS